MADKQPRICISAGHGEASRTPGKSDPGAEVVAYTGTEDDIVLNLAKSVHADLARLFRAKGRGVSFLRNSGVYHKADDYAAERACDIFIELHTDAGPKTASGTSALYESDISEAFAGGLAYRVSKAMGIWNRGARKRTDLAVLRPHPGMRSVLLEVMFGSNPKDVKAYLANRDAVVLAIVNGILKNRGWAELKKRPTKMTWLALKAYRPF